MGGYTKNIAVIRGLKSGFSADGGQLSGLVKAEKYGKNLKIEVSPINFAPLTQGKYVCAVSDGKNVCILDGNVFDGESEVDTGEGFGALICFVNGEVSPVASAVCGAFHTAVLNLRAEIEKQENCLGEKTESVRYEDEALAEENYYEYGKTDENGRFICEDKAQKKDGTVVCEDEKSARAFKDEGKGGLAGGSFYDNMREEIEKVLSSYPKEDALETTVENSRWVKIDYGEGKFYVFGIIYGGGEAQYICYGVPSADGKTPPAGLDNCSFIPSSEDGGYWVMYQDAKTGAAVKIYNA